MKRKRNLELCPDIERPSKFMAMWRLWWTRIQPSWCGCDSLLRNLPVNAGWEPIFRCGPNGLALVIMALSWWIHSVKDNEEFSVDLRDAIDDVSWVVLGLIDAAVEASGK
jgi:hypothetical protein